MKKKVFAVLKVVLLIVLIFIALFPIYWLTSLRSSLPTAEIWSMRITTRLSTTTPSRPL